MANQIDVVVLVGSLRKESFTRKTAKALVALAPARLKLRFVEIGDLPHYNQDLDPEHPPAQWVRAWRAEERDRRGFAALWQERIRQKARGGDQRFAGRDWRLRRQSSFAAVSGVLEHGRDAATGGLYRARGGFVR